MKNEDNIHEEQKEPTLSVIQKLIEKQISVKSLDEETILECVYVLKFQQDYTVEQIAKVFDQCNRTINRLVKKLRERLALVAGENFEKEFLGDMEQRALSNYSFFIRLSTDKENPPSDRIQARRSAWETFLTWAKYLQSVGTISQRQYSIGADVHHHLDSFNEQDILDIKVVAEQTGLTESLSKLLKDVSKEEPKPQKEEEKDNGKEPEK